MLSMSHKPLPAGQTRKYHEREFASQKQNDWSWDRLGHSEWQGKLAEKWGLQGPVSNEEFARLTEGQHPLTFEQLVRHQPQKKCQSCSHGTSGCTNGYVSLLSDGRFADPETVTP